MTILTAFTGCKKDEYHSRLPELIVKDMTFEQGSDKKEQVFRNEDLSNFAVVSDQAWCVPQVDIQNSKLIVAVSANDTYDARTATVTITDVKDNTVRTFSVTQAQFDDILIEGELKEVEMEGGEVSIEVKSNVNYTVQVDGVDWITYTSTRGLETSTVLLSVAKNNSGAIRAGIVRILNSEKGIEQAVTIRQKFTPVFSIPVQNVTIDELGGEFAIPVKANFPLDLYVDTWMVKGEKEYTDDENYIQTFKASAYTEKDAGRTGKIYFEHLGYNIAHTVTVTQERTLYIPKSTISIMAGDSIQIDYKNTKNHKVKWASSVDTVATVNQNGLVKGIGDGTARITVTSEDGKYSDYVDVVATSPKDLQAYFSYDWVANTKTVKTLEYDVADAQYFPEENPEVTLVSSIVCAISNKSDYTIQLKKCTLYRQKDENSEKEVVRTQAFNEKGGTLAPNGVKTTLPFDDLIVWNSKSGERSYDDGEPEPEPEPTPTPTPAPEPTDDDNTGDDTGDNTDNTGDNTDNSGTDNTGGSSTTRFMAPKASKVVKKNCSWKEVDATEYIYSITWYYSYYGKDFEYNCAEIKSAARSKARRR